jgi:hypothetical protein
MAPLSVDGDDPGEGYVVCPGKPDIVFSENVIIIVYHSSLPKYRVGS